METILIEDRKSITIKGAEKVVCSTNTQAIVEISGTNLIISGKDIELKKLDIENKEVVFIGEFCEIKFSNKTEKTPIFKRLFK